MSIAEEISVAMQRCREWDVARGRMDRGNYRENPGRNYVDASKIVAAYQRLQDELIKWERTWGEVPPAE